MQKLEYFYKISNFSVIQKQHFLLDGIYKQKPDSVYVKSFYFKVQLLPMQLNCKGKFLVYI